MTTLERLVFGASIGAVIGGLLGLIVKLMGWEASVPGIMSLSGSSIITGLSQIVVGIGIIALLASMFEDAGCVVAIIILMMFGGHLLFFGIGIHMLVVPVVATICCGVITGAAVGASVAGIEHLGRH